MTMHKCVPECSGSGYVYPAPDDGHDAPLLETPLTVLGNHRKGGRTKPYVEHVLRELERLVDGATATTPPLTLETFASMVSQAIALYNVPTLPNRSKPRDHAAMTKRDRGARRSDTARATPSDLGGPAR